MKDIIDDEFLNRLSNLEFMLKSRTNLDFSGTHSENRSGVSLEFADFRDYTPGDDFRYIDWNATARSDRVLVKRFLKEFDVPVNIMLDISESMALGDPCKAHYGARLALGLAFVGLEENDRVGLFAFTDGVESALPPHGGRKQLRKIIGALRDLEPEGDTSVVDSVDDFLASTVEKGLLFIISDLLTEEELEDSIYRLKHEDHDVVVLQLLDPRDLRPNIKGGGRVIGVESGEELEIGGGSRVFSTYQNRIERFIDKLRKLFSRNGIVHMMIPTDMALEDVLLRKLREKKVLK